jgi:hypothetical protein
MKKIIVLAILALSMFASSATNTRENPVPMCNPCPDSAGN